MRRIQLLAISTAIALILPAFFIVFARQQAANPSPTAVAAVDVWGDPHVGIVVDTTAGRQPALDTLAQSVTGIAKPYTQTFHLTAFRDQANYLGNTTDPDVFALWLDNLMAAGGDDCADNALAGLLEAARQAPPGNHPTTNVLLQTDATPIGGIAAYQYTANRLLQRGVRVETVINGWCPNADSDKRPLDYLTLSTGGRFWETDGPNFYTDTLISRYVLSAGDLIASFQGQVTPGNPAIEPLEIDSSIQTLDASSTTCCPCLTCTLQLASPVELRPAAPMMLGFELLDPEGTTIDRSLPGVSEFGSAQRHLVHLDHTAAITSGTWGMLVSGDGNYLVDVFANSTLHMAYLSRRSLPAGIPANIHALIVDETIGRGPTVLTHTFSLASYNGDTATPIMLFDDGMHGDGQAGDGLFGGTITPTPGLWRLAVTGTLNDGSPFQRIDPAPIRVRPFRLPEPPGGQALPGHTRTVNFLLTNDSPGEGGIPTTYNLGVFSEQGWVVTGTLPVSVTLQAGESQAYQIQISIPLTATVGTIDETTFIVSIQDDLTQSAAAVALTTVVDELKIHLPLVMKPADP